MTSTPAADLARSNHRVQLEMLAAVLGGDGLGPVAELAAAASGGPVVIVAPQLGGPWTAPPGSVSATTRAAVDRYVAQQLGGRRAEPPWGLAREVAITTGDQALGTVILLEGSAPPHGDAHEVLRFAAVAALTESAIHEARLDGEQRLRGSLLEELREQTELDSQDLVRRAARMGSNLSQGAVSLCAQVDADHARRILSMLAGECPGALAEYLRAKQPDAPSRLHALIPATGEDPAGDTRALARRLAVRIGRHGVVGISSFCPDAEQLGRAVQEAELMLDVLLQSDSEAPIAQAMPSMGTYRLLFRVLISNPGEIQTFFTETIGPLVAYDDQYRTELLGTLKAYLANNCSMNATAETLFAHRHTVAYRLDRIQELTGLDPRNAEHREQLGLGLKAYRIIQSQAR